MHECSVIHVYIILIPRPHRLCNCNRHTKRKPSAQVVYTLFCTLPWKLPRQCMTGSIRPVQYAVRHQFSLLENQLTLWDLNPHLPDQTEHASRLWHCDKPYYVQNDDYYCVRSSTITTLRAQIYLSNRNG